MPKQDMTTSMAYLWDPNRILLSRRVKKLSAEEECWYRRALDYSWIDGGLPADPVEAADRIEKGCTPDAAGKIISIFFEPHPKDASKVVNETQEERRKKLQQKLRKLSRAGKESARKRKEQKEKEAQQMLDKCSTNEQQMSGNVSTCNISNLNTLASKKQSAEDFIQTLRSNPSYSHINIDIELARAEAWTRQNERQFTRRFVTNWMDRIEEPLELSPNGNKEPQWKIDRDNCNLCDERGYQFANDHHIVCDHKIDHTKPQAA